MNIAIFPNIFDIFNYEDCPGVLKVSMSSVYLSHYIFFSRIVFMLNFIFNYFDLGTIQEES